MADSKKRSRRIKLKVNPKVGSALGSLKARAKTKSTSRRLKRLEKLDKLSKNNTKEDVLKPESKLARGYNEASDKAQKFGAKELKTPTPKKGILGKRLDPFLPIKWFFRYVRDSYRELKAVTWLSRKDNWKLTGVVFLFSFIMALFLFGLDSIFSKMFELVFLNK